MTEPCISDKSLSVIQTPFHIEDNTALDNSSLTSFEEYASNETTATSKLQRTTEYKSRFIRYSGGSRAMPNRIRMSKTMKRMFKNVFKYQMNAISCLERFYESQVFKLETDRRKNLALNPENSEFIIKFYDKQLAELEERVYSNLTYICRNRCNGSCIDSSHSSSINSNSSFKRQLSLPFKCRLKSTVNRKKCQSSSSIKNPKIIGSSAFHAKILPNGSYQLNDLSYHANDYDYKDFTDGFFSFNNDENGLSFCLKTGRVQTLKTDILKLFFLKRFVLFYNLKFGLFRGHPTSL